MVRSDPFAMLILGAYASCSLARNPELSCVGDARIAPGRAGAIAVGMSIDSVAALCPIAQRTSSPDYNAHILSIPVGRDTLRVWTSGSRVDWIDVTSPRYRTTDSLGVGVSALRLLELRDLRGGTGEGDDAYVLFSGADHMCGLSFRLDPHSSQRLSRTTSVRDDLRKLSPGATVVAVWVGPKTSCAPYTRDTQAHTASCPVDSTWPSRRQPLFSERVALALPEYAGAFRDDSVFTVLLTTLDASERADTIVRRELVVGGRRDLIPGLRFTHARYSYRQLRSWLDCFVRATGIADLYAWGVDERSNRISIDLETAGARPAVLERVRQLGFPIDAFHIQ